MSEYSLLYFIFALYMLLTGWLLYLLAKETHRLQGETFPAKLPKARILKGKTLLDSEGVGVRPRKLS
jgi:hypothetical protein